MLVKILLKTSEFILKLVIGIILLVAAAVSFVVAVTLGFPFSLMRKVQHQLVRAKF